jgi:hypothetical protein
MFPSSALRAPVRLRRLAAGLGAAAACTAAVAAGAPAAHASTSYYKLAAKHSYLVLDVSGGSTAPGARVIQWYDNGGANQHWTLPIGRNTTDSEGTGFVRNQHSGMCLTTDGRAGDQLFQFPCLTTAAGDAIPQQNWDVKRVNADGVSWFSDQLTNVGSGLVVDINGDSYKPGAAAITWYRGSGFNGYALNQVFEQYAA